MKKYLIPKEGNFYKANLHCHSTFSDGKYTPEEIKKIYMELGYSIVAFTDHNVFIPHNELTDSNFLAMGGFEADVSERTDNLAVDPVVTKVCHFCCVALKDDTCIHPIWHRSKYLFANSPKYRDMVKFDETKPDYERHYTPESVSEMMKICRDSGFFVTYNHPRWSHETYSQYSQYENMNAMEIYNHSCYIEGYCDYAPAVYDEMLRDGKRIFCVSSDDNHAAHDACGGYVMIKADRLEYDCIADALVHGNFYSSRGPEIKSLWYDLDDSTIHIQCSEVTQIILAAGGRRNRCVAASGNDDKLTEAIFPIKGDEIYVRLTVVDEKGLTADTNAYFLDELS